MWSIRPVTENEPLLLNIENAQMLIGLGYPHPREINAVDNAFFQGLGMPMPDVNMLPSPLDSGPPKLFFKGS